MFLKPRNKTKHAVAHISLNRDAAEEWIVNQKAIGIDHDWNQDVEGQATITIDCLIQHGLFFHRDANQFSVSLEGHQLLGGKLFEWKDFGSELVFYFDSSVIAIFPTDIMLGLIKTGSNGQSRYLAHPKEKFQDLETTTEECFQIMRQFWFSYGVIYWNNLVRVDFTVDPPVTEVEYPDVP